MSTTPIRLRSFARPGFVVLLSLLALSLPAAGPASACPFHANPLKSLGLPLPTPDDGFNQWWDSLIGEEMRAQGAPADPVSLPVKMTNAEVGRWRQAMAWPTNAIHAMMLHTGDVLHFYYRGAGNPFGARGQLWSPDQGAFANANWNLDVMCSGHSFLPDGKVLVSGGNGGNACGNAGFKYLHSYDPETRSWTRLADMRYARWYPTNVTLGDGSVLIVSGLDEACSLVPQIERFVPGQGARVLAGAERTIQLYPRLHLLPDGRVAHVGPELDTFTLDPARARWTHVAQTQLGRFRASMISSPVPGEPWAVMICGGTAATRSCEKIDFSASSPAWRPIAPLTLGRNHADAVVLPDATVLVVGGGISGLYGSPVLNPEVYDPRADTWTLLPPHRYGRMYHATAILLPDARVLVAGQDDSRADGVVSGDWGEIYEPAYLFRGARPRIRSAPAAIGYGGSFEIETSQAADIASVVLIQLSANTHSVNATQTFVPLGFAHQGGRVLRVDGPASGNLAPPGYHMLFAVNAAGVPSEAAMVKVSLSGGGGGGGGGGPGCPLPAGHPHYCRDCGPCAAGAGDCDRDSDCLPGAVCVQNVGAEFGFKPGIDVCVGEVAPGCPLPAGHAHYCRDCGPCAAGAGDCDRDSDCLPGAVCVDDIGPQFGFGPNIDVCQPG